MTQERLDRDLFRLYVGRNVAKYEATLDKMESKDPSLRRYVVGWCWPAFFVPLPWLMYRKQWVVAGAIIVAPIVLDYLFGNLSYSFLGALVAMQGKSFYVAGAARKIRKISKIEPDPAARRDRIMRAGGVSVAGAVLGTLVVVVLAAFAFAAVYMRAKGIR